MKKIFFLFISTLIFLILLSGNLEASAWHSQPTPTAVSQESAAALQSIGGTGNLIPMAVNFYFNPIIADKNYQLRDGDTVCAGDEINLQYTLTGEWFTKGGSYDSPPITFLTDEQFQQTVDSIKQKKSGLRGSYLASGSIILWQDPSHLVNWAFYATMFCTGKDAKPKFSGQVSNQFTVESEGTIDVKFDLQPSCVFYIEKALYVYLKPLPSGQTTKEYPLYFLADVKIPSLSSSIHLNAVSPSSSNESNNVQGAKLEIVGFSGIGAGGTTGATTVLIKIKNTGDTAAILDNITSRNGFKFQLLNKPTIRPGETADVYVETLYGSSYLNASYLDLSYRSVTLGCQDSKEKGPQLYAACTSDSQCTEGKKCCQNLCRDSENGICRDLNGDGIPDWLVYK